MYCVGSGGKRLSHSASFDNLPWLSVRIPASCARATGGFAQAGSVLTLDELHSV